MIYEDIILNSISGIAMGKVEGLHPPPPSEISTKFKNYFNF
jgi:hypothetical protein